MIFDILFSIVVCMAARLFFAWLVSVQVSASYVSAGSMHELSLQVFSSVTLEDVAVLGECCPSGRDSLNLIVLVFISVPGKCSFQCSRSECGSHIMFIDKSFFVTTFVFDSFIFRT